ncbi:selenoprotein K-like [Apodemus sylvaticus]|uniref:selenoprotein K-like n=1 Tax=Apodemus sylvaticus TaxID=10129 RepID=UPI0022437A40|nr:selenoprotein K-like [Apodemus sylvaticus]
MVKLDSRTHSPWRLSFVIDFIWGIAESVGGLFVCLFVCLFFGCLLFHKTRLRQDVKKRRGSGSSSDSRYNGGRGPPGNPLSRMGQISHLHGPSPPPMAGG